MERFATNRGLQIVLAVAVLTIIILLTRPAYDERWESSVRASEHIASGLESVRLSLAGGEYLDDVRVRYGNVDSTLSGRANVDSLVIPGTPAPSLCMIDTRTELVDTAAMAEDAHLAKRVVEIRAATRPLRVVIRYRSPDTLECVSPWAARAGGRLERMAKNTKVFSWYAYPDSVLVVPVTFFLRGRQRVAESIEVTFDGLLQPVRLERPWTYFTRRTIVTREDTFGAPRFSDRLATMREGG
jgi:hypothetical protein